VYVLRKPAFATTAVLRGKHGRRRAWVSGPSRRRRCTARRGVFPTPDGRARSDLAVLSSTQLRLAEPPRARRLRARLGSTRCLPLLPGVGLRHPPAPPQRPDMFFPPAVCEALLCPAGSFEIYARPVKQGRASFTDFRRHRRGDDRGELERHSAGGLSTKTSAACRRGDVLQANRPGPSRSPEAPSTSRMVDAARSDVRLHDGRCLRGSATHSAGARHEP